MSNLIGTITTNTQVITGVVQEVGRQGYSAYEVALLNPITPFVGTEEEWLESLRGTVDVQQTTGNSTTLVMSQDAVTKELDLKVNKELDKSLVADSEILRLSTVVNFDNSPNVLALNTKVDKEAGKSLISSTEITRLSTVTNFDNSGNVSALSNKVDKEVGKQLTDENYTLSEKQKLAGLESSKWKGLYTSFSALPVTGVAGDYADVDTGVGSDVERYLWDVSDAKWVLQGGSTSSLTGAEIKQLYEAQPDTNAFSDAEKGKLAGIATEATKNRTDAATDTLLSAKVDKVAGSSLITDAEKARLSTVVNFDNSGNVSALATKVDKEEGKSLIANSEISRLAGVSNYNDSPLALRVTNLESSVGDIDTALAAILGVTP